jgi:rhomboid protease GluP
MITATNILILLNVIDYIWVATTGGFDDTRVLLAHGALSGDLVRQGQWWRIVTGAFMHGGIAHIALNMFALYQVGSFVETIAGKWRMLAVYFIAMLGSGIAVVIFSPDAVTVGASGAIFGLFGALVAIGIRLGSRGRSLIGQVLPIIGINLVFTFLVPNISAAGHIGGLISGFFSGLGIFMMQKQRYVQTVEAPRAAALDEEIHGEEPTLVAAREAEEEAR